MLVASLVLRIDGLYTVDHFSEIRTRSIVSVVATKCGHELISYDDPLIDELCNFLLAHLINLFFEFTEVGLLDRLCRNSSRFLREIEVVFILFYCGITFRNSSLIRSFRCDLRIQKTSVSSLALSRCHR